MAKWHWQINKTGAALHTCTPTDTVGFRYDSAASGKRMFGKGSNDQDNQSGDKEWVEGLQAVDLPPVDTLMQACLLQPIQEQVPRRMLHALSSTSLGLGCCCNKMAYHPDMQLPTL